MIGERELIFMVKADAYNHGVEGVVHIANDIIDRYGVATIEEGIKLRAMGIKKPVSVFLYGINDYESVVKNRLTPIIYNESTLNSILNKGYDDFEFKIDTGMNRLGFKTQKEINFAFDKMLECNKLPRAIHTHFYSKDSVPAQIDRFWTLLRNFESTFLESKKILSASQGINCGVFADGVRAGLIAYKGALKVTSSIIEVKDVSLGESVGYDGKYKPKKSTKVALISGGYYDGIKRTYEGADVVVRGGKHKIVGKVSMDSTFIELGDTPLQIGEHVTLIDASTLDSYIKVSNSSEYEVITSVNGRAKRTYLYNGQKYDTFSY